MDESDFYYHSTPLTVHSTIRLAEVSSDFLKHVATVAHHDCRLLWPEYTSTCTCTSRNTCSHTVQGVALKSSSALGKKSEKYLFAYFIVLVMRKLCNKQILTSYVCNKCLRTLKCV